MKKVFARFAILGVFSLAVLCGASPINAAESPADSDPKGQHPCGTYSCLKGMLQTPTGCGGNMACMPHADAYFSICVCTRTERQCFDPMPTKRARWERWLSHCNIKAPSIDFQQIQQVHDYFGPSPSGPSNYDHPCVLNLAKDYCCHICPGGCC